MSFADVTLTPQSPRAGREPLPALTTRTTHHLAYAENVPPSPYGAATFEDSVFATDSFHGIGEETPGDFLAEALFADDVNMSAAPYQVGYSLLPPILWFPPLSVFCSPYPVRPTMLVAPSTQQRVNPR